MFLINWKLTASWGFLFRQTLLGESGLDSLGSTRSRTGTPPQ